MVEYSISENMLHINDSAFVPKRLFRRNLVAIRELHPNSEVWNRSYCSLELEWSAHSFLYMLGIFKSHTKDVDLESPQKWYLSIGYAIVGAIGWIFID